jgi:hypothetical protein
MTFLARLKANLFCALPAIEVQPFQRTAPDTDGKIRPKPERKEFRDVAVNIWRAQIMNATPD